MGATAVGIPGRCGAGSAGWGREPVEIERPSRWDGHHLLLAPSGGPSPVVEWAERGLERGDKLFYAGGAYASLDELVGGLGEAGLDAEQAAADGRLEAVDPARFYSVTGFPALVEEAAREGFRGVGSFSGPAAAAAVLDGPGFDRFERVLDELATCRGVSAVCCYRPGADELDRAVARHSSGWADRLLHAQSPGPGRLRL